MSATKCPRCGKDFEVKAYRLKNGKRPLCSYACMIKKEPRNCSACGKGFMCKPHRLNQERVYCSRECSRETRFSQGLKPWNKGAKGIHLSPSTEFKKGALPANLSPVGTVRIRRHKGDSFRAWVKVAQPNKWMLRAQLVWIANHGPIPAGKVVHHKDRDTLNDDISNLELLTKAEHLKEHREEIRKPR